ncbi:hypothetical protein CHS0354_008450 [Potamilus streckersoni]|uniref:Uncharacterized protein n=1 Tax=Potamilus streckersoni TaxID=2493646 RepID=A0AAE0VHR9_9BIVA|nr:hypothetical protein CHS0354_008450 [Potamilus streckersoni]
MHLPQLRKDRSLCKDFHAYISTAFWHDHVASSTAHSRPASHIYHCHNYRQYLHSGGYNL